MAKSKIKAMGAFADDLAANCLKNFGGASGIAQQLWAAYTESDSNTARVKILEMVTKIVGESAARSDADDLQSQEDLEREIAILKGKLESRDGV